MALQKLSTSSMNSSVRRLHTSTWRRVLISSQVIAIIFVHTSGRYQFTYAACGDPVLALHGIIGRRIDHCVTTVVACIERHAYSIPPDPCYTGGLAPHSFKRSVETCKELGTTECAAGQQSSSASRPFDWRNFNGQSLYSSQMIVQVCESRRRRSPTTDRQQRFLVGGSNVISDKDTERWGDVAEGTLYSVPSFRIGHLALDPG